MRWEYGTVFPASPELGPDSGTNSLALRLSGRNPGSTVRGQDLEASFALRPVILERKRAAKPTGAIRKDVATTERVEVDRAEKREFVTSMNEAFSNAGAIVVAHYAGLTVSQLSAFRAKMKDAGGSVKVAKNRLAKIALQGTEAEKIVDLFKGQTLVCMSNDPISAPKVAVEFAKTNDKLVIIGGAMGSTSLDQDGVKALASLPSLDELRAKLVGMIVTPATRIAQVVNAPASQLARVFAAYAKKDEAA